MKSKKFKIALLVLALLAFYSVWLWVPFHPAEVRSFLGKISDRFESSNEPIKVADITTFPWDRVCVVNDIGTLMFQNENPAVVKRFGMHIRKPSWREYALNKITFIFIKGDKVERWYSIQKESISINGQYAFFYPSQGDKTCFAVSDAYVIKDDTDKPFNETIIRIGEL